MKLIVNIPAYNEEAKIGETIKRIKASFSADFYSNQETGAKITEKLIQVVDDGSSDNTAKVAQEAGVDLLVSYKPNRRLAYAFKRAVENCLENKADLMVNIDADGQFNPNDIPLLLSPILLGQSDMVIANRFGEHEAKNMPKIKYQINRLGAAIVGYFLNYQIDDLTCGFRAHNRETLLRLNITNVSFTYTQETIIDAIGKNLKLQWVPVKVQYFADRKSRIVKSVWKFVSSSAKIILKAVRDVRPMKFFGIPGIIFIATSVLVFCLFLVQYFQTFQITTYRNYLFLTAALLFVGSQLVIFALIADMIKTNRNLTEEQMYLQKKERYNN